MNCQRFAVLFSVFVMIASSAIPATAQPTPRTAWGDPDLGGIWDYRTITPMQRPEKHADQEFLTEEEAAALEQGAVDREIAASEAPAVRTEVGGSIGCCNRFWLDYGTTVVGERRTSLIVDPPNGRRPPMTPDAQEAASKRPRWGQEPPPDTYADLSSIDRCMGSTGLPIIPAPYNNNVQIFQTPDHVAILIESMHLSRIISLDGRPHANVAQYVGDSRGRWEGDTLVVETMHFDGGLQMIAGSVPDRLVERFTRVGESIQYAFTVEDAETWVAPWTAAVPLTKTEAPIFEYACHEGNYAMVNMLAGARAGERAAAAAQQGAR